MPTAAIAKQVITQGNTQALTIEGLMDATTSTFLNDWTNIQMTLVDDQGNPVAGCTEIDLTYVANSNGNYTGVFGDGNFYPALGTNYKLLIDGNNAGSYLHIETLVEVKARRF
jgi:hypothetical protein